MKKLSRASKIVWGTVGVLILLFVIFDITAANRARGTGDYGSITANETALKKNPNDAAAHRGIGHYDQMTRDYDKALFHFQEALRLEPDNNENQFNLAIVLARMGRDDEAIAIMKKAAEGGGIAGDGARKLLPKMQTKIHAMADKKWLAGDRTLLSKGKQIRPNSDMKKDQ